MAASVVSLLNILIKFVVMVLVTISKIYAATENVTDTDELKTVFLDLLGFSVAGLASLSRTTLSRPH